MGKLIDKADWQKSVLLIKSKEEMPKCPDNSDGLDPMPPRWPGRALNVFPLLLTRPTW